MFGQISRMIVVSGLLLVPAAAQAASITDGGGFFSGQAIANANEAIDSLQKQFGHDVRIETYAAVPQEKGASVSRMNAREREAFFSGWLHERAEATRSRGIVILICKEPAHLRLWAGKPLERSGFGAAQAKPIRETLLSGFKARTYDAALNSTLAQIRTAFEGLSTSGGHARATPAATPHKAVPQRNAEPRAAPQATGTGGLIFVIAIVIGAILVISLVSRLFGGGQGATGAGYGPGYGAGYGGGGGFMRSLAGGLFGAMAGHWLYDQFSGHHHAHGNDSTWSGSDHSSGGDDGSSWADSGGGTDFGGGDFGGGGDAGGGDF